MKTSGAGTAEHYEGERQESEDDNTCIERVLAGTEPNKDDIFVIKTKIASDKFSYKAFVYNGSAWAAMDGNYNAGNVYFDKDLMTTSAIGNITLDNGQATVSAAGKNLNEVWNAIFVKEQNPTATQPAVTLNTPQNKAYEVGTTVTPTYTATLSAGSYTYGPATGITASTWEVTDTNKGSKSTASGSFDEFTVQDDTNYTITAKATYPDGATPVTNLGNEYEAAKIKAGSATKTSGKITGFRNSFYGTTDDKEPITSDTIRGLTASGKALANGGTFNVTIPVGAMRVIIAYPATLREINSVLDVNGLNAEIKSGFTQQSVDVEGANKAAAKPYRVYVMEYAKANDTPNTYKVTI